MPLWAAILVLFAFLAGLGVILYGMGSMSGGADEASDAELDRLMLGDHPWIPLAGRRPEPPRKP